MTTQTIQLKRNGHYIGVDPSAVATVYADRSVAGAWEAVALTRHDDGRVDARFVAADVQLSIQPDGTLQTRPAGTFGEWEQLVVTTQPPDGVVWLSRPGVLTSCLVEGYRETPIAPVVTPVAPLTIQGRDFVQDGQRRVLNGLDAFRAYRQFLDLDGAGLTSLLEESTALGFTLWRVFLAGSVAQNGILELRPTDPGYYEGLRPFADLLNQHGIVLLATVFVDNQDVHASIDHWRKVADALRGSVTLLSGGNQWSKNGWHPGDLTDPGMLWSRGSDVGDVAPFQPHGAFAEFHPRRDLPAALMDTVASAVFIDKTLSAPLVISEPPRMGSDGSGAEFADPFLCWKFARHYATECAGAVFHNACSMRGQLMDGQTRACAEAWSRGMRL